jgi:hypothetical protein
MPVTKIVINSHIKYMKCLAILLQSILSSDFLNTKSTEDIIISISQAPEDTEPRLATIASLFATDDVWRMTPLGQDTSQVVVITATMNSFDWTAMHMLSVHRDHALMPADYYLYLLDTSKADVDFWSKVEKVNPNFVLSFNVLPQQ